MPNSRTTIADHERTLSALLLAGTLQECYLLKWQTPQTCRQVIEFDPKFFNEEERIAFCEADTTEWKPLLQTGADEVVLPPEAAHLSLGRIFSRPKRRVLTNKNKEEKLCPRSQDTASHSQGR